jgi:hypothetical protein
MLELHNVYFYKEKITKGIEEGLLRRNLLYYGK